MIAWGVLAAAGAGTRLGLDDGVPKAMRPLAGRPMFWHSLRAFDGVDRVEGVVLVVDDLWLEHALSELYAEPLRVKVELVRGGETRRASVRAGLEAVPDGADVIVVHDAARPLVTHELVARVLDGLRDADAAIAALPESDTLKRARRDTVVETVPREDLWRAQTPQAFRAHALRAAHGTNPREEATDDAALIERAGGRVRLVPGDSRNLKVTTREDLDLAESLLRHEKGAR